jgi:hypothetical protein
MSRRVAVVLAVLSASAVATTAAAEPGSCASLAALHLPDTTITSAAPVTGGPLPAYCQVVGVIKPTADSQIGFETWLPLANWNGKFNAVGGGGFVGSINTEALSRAVLRGYATATTDTGHLGGDASWALGHPEKVIDFGPRSMHLTTQIAKALVRAFYGERPRFSYYTGCSTGGRQGLMEAQQFPEDFDGLVVGAPANYWTHLLTAAAAGFQAHLKDPQSWFGPQLMPILEGAVNAKCDALDGITDGIVSDPRKCDFNPSSLICRAGQDPNTCFSAKQAAAVAKIYAGPKNPRTGEQIYPGLLPGAESGAGGWPAWITGAAPGGALLDFFATQYFKFFVFQDPNYNLFTFDFDKDLAFNDASIGRFINAINPDLRPLQHRGAKILHYHGWNDPAISSLNSINYYESVVSFFTGRRDTRAEALGEVQEFYRLFMVPGMQHCGGGPGPNAFGGPFALPAPVMDAEHDVLSALERWVERGKPPSKLIATKFAGDDPAAGITMQRPLCPFPKAAVYTGHGSTNDAASFKCRAAHSEEEDDDD